MVDALPTALGAFDPTEIPSPSKLIALLGRGGELHPLILQSLFVRAARGERLGLVVADNCFNDYALARCARAGGFGPAEFLRRIEFSRPFTCHQLHHCLTDLVQQHETPAYQPDQNLQPNPGRSVGCAPRFHVDALQVEETRGGWSALYVLGLLDGLYDEDIRWGDATRLLEEILARLRRLAAGGLSVLVTLSPPPTLAPDGTTATRCQRQRAIDVPSCVRCSAGEETNRASFIPRVLRAADAYWQPSPLAIEQLVSPQLAMW